MEVPVVPRVILMEQQRTVIQGRSLFPFPMRKSGPWFGETQRGPGTYPKDREAQAGISSLAAALPPTGWHLVPHHLEKKLQNT